MKILEWSDTQLKFHITESEWTCGCDGWTATDVDLTQYDKIVLEMRYKNGVAEYEWEIVNEDGDQSNSNVVFVIYSESSVWRVWTISCDIWGIKADSKVRFNWHTINWEILPSIVIPEWTVNN